MHFAYPQELDFLHSLAPVSPQTQGASPYYFFLPDIQSLRGVLAQPSRIFLETGPRPVLEEALAHIQAENPDFALNVRNGSALGDTLSDIIAIALQDRFRLTQHKRMDIRTCLHEAIINAAIHGNLGMANPEDSPVGFDEYYVRIDAIADKEPYRSRRIGIYAWCGEGHIRISVSDQGGGFANRSIIDHAPDATTRYGRGLFMIRSMAERVWIEADNRTLSMTFKC